MSDGFESPAARMKFFRSLLSPCGTEPAPTFTLSHILAGSAPKPPVFSMNI
jgi:hypothetical protein